MPRQNHALRLAEEVSRGKEMGSPSVPLFRDLLRRYLQEQRMSQQQLAKILDTHQANVSRWVLGHTPDVRTAIRFARLIGMDYRVVLASAGLWPEEVPTGDHGPMSPDTAASLARAILEVKPDREPVTQDQLTRLVTAFGALSREQRERIILFLESLRQT